MPRKIKSKRREKREERENTCKLELIRINRDQLIGGSTNGTHDGRSGQWHNKNIKESVNQTLYETRPFIHRILTFNPTQTQTEEKEKNMFACVCVCVCVCALERELCVACVR